MVEPETDIIAALPSGHGPVEVVGDGALAMAVRARVAQRGPSDGDPPATIVETTGDPARIAEALRRVADLGTIVLAGPLPPASPAFDLYSDLHVRGLTMVAGCAHRP